MNKNIVKKRFNDCKELKNKYNEEYNTWVAMIRRCVCPTEASYKNYGARGIQVCSDWEYSFQNFIKDMGPKPKPYRKYSIDRINNDGHYEPGNCRWATRDQQNANKRKPDQTGPRKFKNRHPRYTDPEHEKKLIARLLNI